MNVESPKIIEDIDGIGSKYERDNEKVDKDNYIKNIAKTFSESDAQKPFAVTKNKTETIEDGLEKYVVNSVGPRDYDVVDENKDPISFEVNGKKYIVIFKQETDNFDLMQSEKELHFLGYKNAHIARVTSPDLLTAVVNQSQTQILENPPIIEYFPNKNLGDFDLN